MRALLALEPCLPESPELEAQLRAVHVLAQLGLHELPSRRLVVIATRLQDYSEPLVPHLTALVLDELAERRESVVRA